MFWEPQEKERKKERESKRDWRVCVFATLLVRPYIFSGVA